MPRSIKKESVDLVIINFVILFDNKKYFLYYLTSTQYNENNMQTRSYYEILGVKQEATQSDIKRAYRNLARQYHPDKNHTAEATEKFKVISNAYGVLSNPTTRATYDQTLESGYSSYTFMHTSEPVQKTVENLIFEINGLASKNKAAELKAFLIENLQTKLSGANSWNYETSRKLIESTAFYAIQRGFDNILEVLLEAGLSTDAEPLNHSVYDDVYESRFKKQLIHYAVEAGKLSTVKLLVEYGAKVAPTRHEYITYDQDLEEKRIALALRTAIKIGNAEIVEYLLECGADPNGLYYAAHDEEITYLAKAADDGNTAIIESLVNHGLDITWDIMVTYRNRDNLGLKNSYQQIIKTIMDFASGCDLAPGPSSIYKDLYFLTNLDVSQMNFIGVSVAGKPITRALLEKETKSGAKNAIITVTDLMKLSDDARITRINNRLNAIIAKHGCLSMDIGSFWSKERDILNLVPLIWASHVGDIDAVHERIQAGDDPNIEDRLFFIEGYPLVAAAKKGHLEIVKMLATAHANHTANNTQKLINEAKEFIAHHPQITSFTVINGRIKPLPLPTISDKVFVTIPDDVSFTDVIRLMRSIGLDDLKQTIAAQNSISGESKFIMFPAAIYHEGIVFPLIKYESLTPENRKAMLKIILNDHPPFIFTNVNNFDLIEVLIISQAQHMDKAEEIRMKAIDAAKQNGQEAVVNYLSTKLKNTSAIDELIRQRSYLHGETANPLNVKDRNETSTPSFKKW